MIGARIKKMVAAGIGTIALAGLGGAVLADQIQPEPHLDTKNTLIVLPTTLEVNGTPLHVKDDAVNALKLALELYQKGIKTEQDVETLTITVPHKSLKIQDNDQVVYLTDLLLPDLPFNASATDFPVNESIAVKFNFAEIYYNETEKAVVFGDHAVEIIYSTDYSPIAPEEGAKVINLKDENGNDIQYIYDYDNETGVFANVGDELEINGYKIKFLDLSQQDQRALARITLPNGYTSTVIIPVGKTIILYQDRDGRPSIWLSTEHPGENPDDKVMELLKDRAKTVVKFTIDDIFIGVGGTQSVESEYESYTFKAEHKDGEVITGNWVYDINYPDGNHTTVYLKVDGEDFKPVMVKDGESLKLPLKYDIEIVPIFQKDEDGKVIGVEGFRIVYNQKIVKNIVKEKTILPDVKPEDMLVADHELTDIPNNKNIIVVGGWVSNKFWEELQKAYGDEVIEKIKQDVLDEDGKAVEFLKNPYNPDYYIVIVAGRTHEETKQAILELIEELDKA
ncbi:hypothetical protein [Pyrococcus kukulkanii]|uniref:S-layer protein outer domain-containing protein n=1 Tax=Pyrococcus kukulkanii TaxID=1609559 RepID=A0ABV4T961_9EURY